MSPRRWHDQTPARQSVRRTPPAASVWTPPTTGVGRDGDLVIGQEEEGQQTHRFGKCVDALLDQWRSRRKPVLLCRARRLADQSGGSEERYEVRGELFQRQQPDVRGVDGLALPGVEAGRINVDPPDVEGLDHFGNRENVAILGNGPTK